MVLIDGKKVSEEIRNRLLQEHPLHHGPFPRFHPVVCRGVPYPVGQPDRQFPPVPHQLVRRTLDLLFT